MTEYGRSCSCGWLSATFSRHVDAEDAYDDHVRCAHDEIEYSVRGEIAGRSHYDFAPAFPVTVDGKCIAWACSREWALAIEASL